MAINKSVRFKTGALTAQTASNSGIDAYLRVVLDTTTGKAVLAGADAAGVGVAIGKADAQSNITFWTYLEPGTLCHVAAGAIAKYAPVYAAANGKIASSGTVQIGIAMEAAGAAGDVISVLAAGIVAASDDSSGS